MNTKLTDDQVHATGAAFPTNGYGPGQVTIRDYFAGKAMQGDWAAGSGDSFEDSAVRYYKMADAMLAERMKAVKPAAE